jgi:hypothetical protein
MLARYRPPVGDHLPRLTARRLGCPERQPTAQLRRGPACALSSLQGSWCSLKRSPSPAMASPAVSMPAIIASFQRTEADDQGMSRKARHSSLGRLIAPSDEREKQRLTSNPPCFPPHCSRPVDTKETVPALADGQCLGGRATHFQDKGRLSRDSMCGVRGL